jgi:oxygen-independent coproporphyrinogen-3 oxidase
LPEDWEAGGFGIYIHWPFCAAKCPYCDFNSHVVRQIDEDRWLTAYLAEIDRYAGITPGRVVQSIYFGGGTPSLMDPRTVAGILDRIRTRWPQANDVEITLEANPTSVESARFRDYFLAGISRVSMGIQALNDLDLQRLGRLHTADEGLRAFDVARNIFDRVSFDLIYARQDQTIADWEAELSRALSFAVDHLSLYQLTIEAGTAFGDRYKAGTLRGLPDDDLSADMFDITQRLTEDAGLPAYEISNHARPGAESRHNSLYWRYGDYVGIGPGAHGRLTLEGRRHATEGFRMPNAWLEAVDNGSGETNRWSLTQEDEVTEFLLMGMRRVNGIDLKRYETLARRAIDPNVVQELQDLDMIEVEHGWLKTTQNGRRVLNAVISKLLE